jgi:hypothetical protein
MAEAVDGAAAIVEIVATAEIAAIAGKDFPPEISGTGAKPRHSRFRCHSLQLCPTPQIPTPIKLLCLRNVTKWQLFPR